MKAASVSRESCERVGKLEVRHVKIVWFIDPQKSNVAIAGG
jgi:hypothetical protein